MPFSLKHKLLRVNTQDKILFARHLAIMSKSGLALLESIKMLGRQARTRSMKTILEALTKDVSNGQFLSAALAPFGHIFGELFVNIVRIGEVSGTLPESLNYLAAELAKKKELRSKIKSALFYPMIIFIGTIGIVGALIMFVFPKILPVFQSLNFELPLPTRILIVVADVVRNYTVLVAGALAALVAAWTGFLQIGKVRYAWHRVLLAVPIAGKLSRDVNTANFCRTLGVLLRSGSQIVEALSTTAATLENRVYRKALMEAADGVRRGQQISGYLAERKELFLPMVAEMIMVGENTGNLNDTLAYLAGFYEEEINNTTRNLTTILEPLLLIFMGLLVGFVALSIITPIYGITQNIR